MRSLLTPLNPQTPPPSALPRTSPESWSLMNANATNETSSKYSWESKTLSSVSSPPTNVAEPTSIEASFYGAGITVSADPVNAPSTLDVGPSSTSNAYAVFDLTNLLNFPSAYNVTIDTPALPTSCTPPSFLPIIVNHGASVTVLRPPFSSSITLGNFYHSPGSTFTVTVDASEAPLGSCVPVGTVSVTHHPTQGDKYGCTDRKAANYNENAIYEDESCTYMKGRGLTTQSWSYMKVRGKLEGSNSWIFD